MDGGVVQQWGGEEEQAGGVLGHQVLGKSRDLEVDGGVVQQWGGEEEQARGVLGHQVLGESMDLVQELLSACLGHN